MLDCRSKTLQCPQKHYPLDTVASRLSEPPVRRKCCYASQLDFIHHTGCIANGRCEETSAGSRLSLPLITWRIHRSSWTGVSHIWVVRMQELEGKTRLHSAVSRVGTECERARRAGGAAQASSDAHTGERLAVMKRTYRVWILPLSGGSTMMNTISNTNSAQSRRTGPPSRSNTSWL